MWPPAQSMWPPAGAQPLCSGSAAGEPVTVVLTAFLTAAPNVHIGSFGNSGHGGVRAALTAFLQRSPGLCPSNLHVVHDSTLVADTQLFNVSLHRFAPNLTVLGNDVRWDLFAHVLRRIAWDCAFAVDLTDISVLCLPTCHPGRGLIVGSDDCSLGTARWLHRVAGRFDAKTNGTISTTNDGVGASLWRFSHNKSAMVSNCGIVGGHRSVLEPALDKMVAQLHTHWDESRQTRLLPGADMVLWNWAVHMRLASGLPVVTGYPIGPVNLPMHGRLAEPGKTSTCHILHEDERQAGHKCVERCRNEWANRTMGHYWFGHKLQSWWRRMLEAGLRRPTCTNV